MGNLLGFRVGNTLGLRLALDSKLCSFVFNALVDIAASADDDDIVMIIMMIIIMKMK